MNRNMKPNCCISEEDDWLFSKSKFYDIFMHNHEDSAIIFKQGGSFPLRNW